MFIYAVMKYRSDDCTYGCEEIVHLFTDRDPADYVCESLKERGIDNVCVYVYDAHPYDKTQVLDKLVDKLIETGTV